METKLFLIEEHKETIFEGSEIEKWKALVDELGLVCQAELIAENKSPLPFPVMTEAQSVIYGVVLETKTNYKEFRNEAIPLSILSLILLCEKEHYFENIQIWHSRQNPDPLVVGLNFASPEDRINKYTWRMVPSLIAQWGAKIKPMADLIPLWDKFEREQMEENYKQTIANHEKRIRLFNLGISSYIPDTSLPF